MTGSRASDPDPEVPAKVERRRFPPAYRLRILKEVDACKRPGEVGALLRREGLYSSLLLCPPGLPREQKKGSGIYRDMPGYAGI